MTYREWLPCAEEALRQAGIQSSALEATVLAAHARGVDRSVILAHPEWVLDPKADQMLARRVAGEPLAYMLGYREFYGRQFAVDRNVLIPRQETETIIDACLHSEDLKQARTALDLGTGSGCIGLTLKLEVPRVAVTLVDISAAALAVAGANAQSLHAKVELVQTDGFQAFMGRRFDLILSNPPYVGEDDPLPKEVRDHEPGLALFAGPKGLDFYERLAREAPAHLSPEGRMFLELGDGQDEPVAEIFVKENWRIRGFHRDLSGHNRIIELANR